MPSRVLLNAVPKAGQRNKWEGVASIGTSIPASGLADPRVALSIAVGQSVSHFKQARDNDEP